MRRALVAMVLAAFGLAGCSEDSKVVAPQQQYGDPADLVSWVKVKPGDFHAGETIEIQVGVHNPTSLPIVMQLTGCLWFQVTDANQNVVAPGVTLCDAVPTYEMAPGETWFETFAWNGMGAREPLPPGDYLVHADGFVVPATTPVSVQILPR